MKFVKIMKTMNNANTFKISPLIAVIIFSFIINSYFTALPFYMKKMAAGSSEIGIAFASYFSCYLMLCLYQNKIGKKRSTKSIAVLIILLIISLAITSINQAMQSPSIFYLVSALLGLIQASIWPALMSEIVSVGAEKELNKRLGRFNISWAIPMLISPMVAAFLLSKDTLYISLLMIVLLIFLLIVLSFLSIENEKTSNLNISNSQNKHLSLLLLFASSALIAVSIVVMLYKTHLAQLMVNKLNFNETSFALVVTFINLGAVFIFFVQQHWHSWQWNKRWLIASQLVAILAIVFIFSESLLLLFIGALLAGMAHGFMYGAHQFYCSVSNSSSLKAMSKHEIVQSGGIISGSLLAGFAGEINFSMPYITALVILITLLMYQGIMTCRSPQKNLSKINSSPDLRIKV